MTSYIDRERGIHTNVVDDRWTSVYWQASNKILTVADGRNTAAIERVQTQGRSKKSSTEGVLWPSMAVKCALWM